MSLTSNSLLETAAFPAKNQSNHPVLFSGVGFSQKRQPLFSLYLLFPHWPLELLLPSMHHSSCNHVWLSQSAAIYPPYHHHAHSLSLSLSLSLCHSLGTLTARPIFFTAVVLPLSLSPVMVTLPFHCRVCHQFRELFCWLQIMSFVIV